MKLSFYGADQCVTGSCHCIEVNGKKILVDCGLQQGRDEIDNASLPFHPGSIDYVLITHAHIDHSGRVPMLIKNGFQGQIVTTRVTGELLDIMLQDSAHIQESDAEYKNRKNKRAGRPEEEPLYTVADAMRVREFLRTCEYGDEVELCEGVKAVFIDAGHLLGSASIKLELTEGGETRTIVFSGDIGNVDQPIIRDPEFFTGADYVVMESTYGDRNHSEVWSYTDELAQIIDEALGRGGNVVIPSFAVGRTQELLYFIREMKDQGLVKSVPNFPVYVDSPLAKAATTIFCGDLRGYLDEEARDLVKDGTNMFSFPGLHLTETTDESKLLNADSTPKVIISASGMCDAGRIRHHLKYNLWRPDSAVVFVGFQSPGTLGRTLLEGAESVKLFGEDVAVRAKIVNYQGLSSHADRDHLLDWISHFKEPKPQHVFVVHGDRDVAPLFAQAVTEMGFEAHAPQYTEEYDLVTCQQLAAGYLPERKARAFEGAPKVTAVYQRLLQVGDSLASLIRRSKGRDNKTLAAFAETLRKVIEKFEF
jgi:metallo-beta-lactamase family protein